MPQVNRSRAEAATDALMEGTDYDGRIRGDVDTYVGDLLSNLMHLCERDGMDFEDCLRRGRDHFEDEKGEEADRQNGEPSEPIEDDYVISDGRGGETLVSQYGKVLVRFAEEDDAEAFIRAHAKNANFFPNVWCLSDHGNWHLRTFNYDAAGA